MKKIRGIFVALFIVLGSLVVFNTKVFAQGEDTITFTYYEQKEGENLYRLDAYDMPSIQSFRSGVVIYHIDVPKSDNYTFRGWAYYVDGEQKILRAGDQFFDDTDFFALWTPTVRVVDYELDGGANNKDNPYYFFGTDDYTLAEPTKDRHQFLGWYDNAEFDGEPITYLGDKVKSLTLYAKWSAESHEVTFDIDGVTTSVLVDDGEKVIKPEDPVKEGYLFAGWLLDGELFDFNTLIIEPLTLVAKWDIPLTVDSVNTNALNNLITGDLEFEVQASGTHLARMQVRVLLNGNKVVSLTLYADETDPIGDKVEDKEYLYDLISGVTYENGKWEFTFDTTALTNHAGDGVYDFEFRALDADSIHPESERVIQSIDVYNELPKLVTVTQVDKELGLVEFTINATGSKLHALRVDFAGVEWVEFYAAETAWDPENWNDPEIWTKFILDVDYDNGKWTILLDTTAYDDGSYNLEFVALDEIFVNESNKISETLVILNEFEIIYVTYDELVNDPSEFVPTITAYKYGVGVEELEIPQNRISSIFKGWYDNEEFTGEPITEIEDSSRGIVTLYAKWELRVYDVLFVTLLGLDGEEIKTIEVEHAHMLGELPNAPEKEGYIFVAWKDIADNLYDEYSIVLSNLELYPQYVPTTAVVRTETELHKALNDMYITEIEFGADITLIENYLINVGGFTLKTNEYVLNLADYSITFGQTAEYAEYFVEGNFANGTIILNNTNGHFELDGILSSTTDIDVIATASSTAIIKGVWGDLLVEDINGHTIIEATINIITTASGTEIVIKDIAVIIEENDSVILGKVYYENKVDHKVKFMDNEEELYEIEVPNGNKVEKPLDPEKENYKFIGWYLDEELFDFNLVITDNTIVVAKWEVLKYKVIFDVDGELTEVTVDLNEAVTKPENPEKEGHTFTSWLLDDSEYDFDLIVTDNITLVASWTVNKYTITYIIDGVTYDVETYEYGEETSIWAPLKEGYNFRGWSPSPIDYEIMPARDLIFIGSYERIYFKVTFINDDLEEVKEVEYHKQVEKPEDPVKEGYTFAGWLLDGEAFDFGAIITEDIELVAKWGDVVVEPVEFTVTFDLDGAEGEIDPQTVEEGSKVVKPADPTKEDYAFAGWLLDGKAFDFDIPVTEDIELVAKWELIVELDVNTEEQLKAALANENIRVINIKEDIELSEHKLLVNRDDVVINGEDHTLSLANTVGWGSDYLIHLYDVVDIVINDLTLEGGDAAILVNASELVLNNVNLVNHEFGGIELSMGVGLTTTPNLEVTNLTSDLEETIPVIWTDKLVDPDYSFDDLVAYDYNQNQVWYVLESQLVGVTIKVDEEQEVVTLVKGMKVQQPEDPTKEGYTFEGWLLGEEEYNFDTPVTEDIIIVAKLEEIKESYDNHEDFKNTNLTSSYKDNDSFVGAAGVVFNYNRARDEDVYPIDDEGILFQNNTSYIEFMVSNGLSSLSFDYRKGFTGGSNNRQLEVLINGEQIYETDKFGGSGDDSTVHNYLLANQTYSGQVTIKIQNLGAQVTLDNIKWNNYDDGLERVDVTFDLGYDLVEFMIIKVLLGEPVEEPSEPTRAGYKFIGWYLDNEEYNFDLLVNESIELVAKWEEAGLISISEVLEEEIGEEVKFEGIVTGFTDYNSQYSSYDKVWLEDETGAITVYGGVFQLDLAIGDKYEVVGILAEYRGLIQIALGSELTLISENNDLIPSTNIENANTITQEYMARRINLEGKVVSVNGTGRELIIDVGGKNVTVRTNYDSHEVNNHLLTAIVGQNVLLKGIHVDWFNGAQLNPTRVEQVEFVSLTNQEKVDYAITELESLYENKTFDMETAVTLLEKSELGVAISWELDPTNAIADDKWKAVTEDLNVTLTATLTFGEVEEDLILYITIKFVDESQEPEEQELYVETFEDVGLTNYNNFTNQQIFNGTGGSKWDILARTDMEDYAIDGQGLILRRTSDNGYIQVTLENGISEFSFEYRKGWTGGTARKYKVDITNNGITKTYVIPDFGAGTGAQDDIYTFIYEGEALEGEVVIKIYNAGAASTANQATFDNFAWTENK